MAILTSPGINVSEFNLTTTVPGVSTSVGGFAGHYAWGPADQLTTAISEVDLVNQFGKPNVNNYTDFFTASNFLGYSNNLTNVRVANSLKFISNIGATGSGATNFSLTGATGVVVGMPVFGAGMPNNARVIAITGSTGFTLSAGATGALGATGLNFVVTGANSIVNSGSVTSLVKNQTAYLANSPYSGVGPWIAKYPGIQGDALTVYTVDAGNYAGATGLIAGGASTIKSYFATTPSTSTFATTKGATGALDEVHILVVDDNGAISGTAGTVLEKYQFLSKFSDALNDSGNSNYYANVINTQSKYIWWNAAPTTADTTNTAWGTAISGFVSTAKFRQIASTWAADTETSASLSGGQDDYTSSVISANAGYNLFASDTVTVDLVMAGNATPSVVNSIAAITTARKDNVLFFSPQYSDVVNNSGNETTAVIATFNSAALNSSYAFMDCNWKYQYDKYNDLFRWVPLNGDIAGLCARTDQTNDPWYSPAGYNRGVIKNIVKLAWNPSQANRDALYPVGINPVISQPGLGTVLFGDKTALARPSAFDRINVRRLFIVLEKSIAAAAKFSLFELNNTSTRAQFVGLVEPFLRTVKGRNGITDFKVVCDTTNNTPQVIDSNQFVGDIYIKPARSINYIQLNFVAVATGVEFNTIVGQF